MPLWIRRSSRSLSSLFAPHCCGAGQLRRRLRSKAVVTNFEGLLDPFREPYDTPKCHDGSRANHIAFSMNPKPY